MRTEQECKQNDRFLFSDEFLSDKGIESFKFECVKRCKDKPKGDLYEKFIYWSKKEKEVAIFTLYAYADLSIPKKFNIIFQLDKPENFIKTEYTLTQCLYEAWYPFDSIGHGHKHLCIFEFEDKIPGILDILHKTDGWGANIPKGQILLGFCNSDDFGKIKERRETIKRLKQEHGIGWLKYDEEN